MTNEQKFIEMGFADYSFIRSPMKIMINDKDTLHYKEYAPNVINCDDWVSSSSIHGINCCMEHQIASNFTKAPIQLYYTNRSLTETIDLCMEIGCKIISRSQSAPIMTDQLKSKVQTFIDWGGVWFNSAGNDVNQENNKTLCDENYCIGVGVMSAQNRDNWGSLVVSYDSWLLPSLPTAQVNIFTHTSSAQPIVCHGCSVLVYGLGFDHYDLVKIIKEKAKSVLPNLEEGEVLFQMPKIKKTEIKMEIGGKAYINGVEKTLDVPAQIVNGRTLVPFRFIGESLGCDVSYTTKPDKSVKDVTLTKYGI